MVGLNSTTLSHVNTTNAINRIIKNIHQNKSARTRKLPANLHTTQNKQTPQHTSSAQNKLPRIEIFSIKLKPVPETRQPHK